MRRPLALTLVLALGLAACGGEDQPAEPTPSATQAAAVTQTVTPPAAAPTVAATATATATASVPAAEETTAPETITPEPEGAEEITPPPTATPLSEEASKATPTPTPKPKAQKLNGPLRCLRDADVKNPVKSGTGLWSGTLATAQDIVAVDGPYPSPRDAQKSVETLETVSDAKVGGNYVVSANLSAKAKATVTKVAECLNARDS